MTDEWLRALPTELAPQRAVMQGLIEHAKTNDQIRAVVVGASIGRGNADALSDIDAWVGIRDSDAWRDSLAGLDAGLAAIAPVLDLHSQFLNDPNGRPYRHTFIEYVTGVQVDLTASPALAQLRPHREWVVLYDVDGRVSGEPEARDPTADQIRTWMFGGLGRLSASGKYLRRGSLWEAHASLEAARADLWRMWAVTINAPDPQFGLTAVLDVAHPTVPDGIERTIAPLDRVQLREASIACLDLLVELWPKASDEVLPAFTERVRAQLLALREA